MMRLNKLYKLANNKIKYSSFKLCDKRESFSTGTSNPGYRGKSFGKLKDKLASQIVNKRDATSILKIYETKRSEFSKLELELTLQKISMHKPKTVKEKALAKNVVDDVLARLHEFDLADLSKATRYAVSLNIPGVGTKFCEKVADLIDSESSLSCTLHEAHNFAWAFAKAGFHRDTTVKFLLDVISSDLNNIKTSELAIVVWAFAKIGVKDQNIFNSFAEVILTRTDQFKPDNLSGLFWAYAYAGIKNDSLFDVLSDASLSKLDRFKPQDMAKTIWACGKLNYSHDDLFSKIAVNVNHLIDGFKCQELSMIVHGFAKVGKVDGPLFDSVEAELSMSADHFKPMELTNVTWAYSKLNISESNVYSIVQKQLLTRISMFNPHELAIIVWSFSNVNKNIPDLFFILAKQLISGVDKLRPNELSIISYAYSNIDLNYNILFESMSPFITYKIKEFNPVELANTAKGFASLSIAAAVSTPVFQAIASESEKYLTVFEAEDVVSLMWAASVSQSPDLLKLADSLISNVDVDFVKSLHSKNIPLLFESLVDLKLNKPDDFDLLVDEEVYSLTKQRFVDQPDCDVENVSFDLTPDLKNLSGIIEVNAKVSIDVGYQIDFQLETSTGTIIALQILDPQKHLYNESDAVKNSILMRHRHLEKLGWTVVTVLASDIVKNKSKLDAFLESQLYLNAKEDRHSSML